MGKHVSKLAKAVSGNSGNASNGKWTLTGVTKESHDRAARDKEPRRPKKRG